MRILFFGTPDFAVPCLEILHEAGYEILGVVTQPDKPQGRAMKLTAPPTKEYAIAKNIPVFQPERLKEGQLQGILDEIKPDLCAVVAYGKILPEYVLKAPKYGCVNVHGSLLPAYRGAAPIQWAILNGDKITGVTTMFLDAGMDTGNIIFKQETPIGENETAGELFDRLAEMGAELLLKTVKAIEAGTAPSVPQDNGKATYAPMLSKENALIDWNRSAEQISAFIRGNNPWPVTQTVLEGAPLKIFSAVAEKVNAGKTPGDILSADKEGIRVACGEGILCIREIQAQGKKRMDAGVYVNGHRLAPGTRMGDAQ